MDVVTFPGPSPESESKYAHSHDQCFEDILSGGNLGAPSYCNDSKREATSLLTLLAIWISEMFSFQSVKMVMKQPTYA
eukprot:2627391-Amphidinium_carterae.1